MTVGPGGDPRSLARQYLQAALNHGGLDTDLGGMPMPAGASVAASAASQSNQVQLTKDESVAAAIQAQTSKFDRYLEMQARFNANTTQMIGEMRAQVAAQRQQQQAAAITQASGGAAGSGLGAALAGMTTGASLAGGAGKRPSEQAIRSGLFGSPIDLSMYDTPSGYASPNWRRYMGAPGAPMLYGGVAGGGGAPPSITSLPPSAGGAGGSYGAPRNLYAVPGGGGGAGGGGGGGGVGGTLALPGPTPGPSGGVVHGVKGNKISIPAMYQEFLSQQAKNRRFQEIEGGSNIHGMGERVGEWFGRWGHLRMGGGDYRKAYEGVTQLGYWHGDTRDRMVNWIDHQQQVNGMSVDDSLKMLGTYAENGKNSLHQMSAAIHAVTDAANKFGVNAKMVRDKLLSSYQTATDSGLGGGALMAATVATTTMTQYGKQFQNSTFDGAFSQQMQYVMAGESGMTTAQFMGAEANNPVAFGRAVDRNISMNLGPLINALKPWVMQEAQKFGGTDALTRNPDLVNYMVQDLMGDASALAKIGNIDPFQLAQVIQRTTGASVDPNNAYAFLIQQCLGNTPGKVAAQLQSQAGITTSMKSGEAQALKKSPHQQNVGAYKQEAKRTGQYSGVLASLAESASDHDQVVVDTPQGKMQMSLHRAIQMYPGQVAAGNVMIVSGADKGETTGKLAGMSDSSQATRDKAASEAADSTLANNAKAKGKGKILSTKDWQEAMSGMGDSAGNTGSTQKVQIDFTPQAKQFLQVASGDNHVSPAGVSNNWPPGVTH